MSKSSAAKEKKKKVLKEMIGKLHNGAKPEDVKEKFKEVLGETTSTDIAELEEELVKEGLPREEITKLCDVHLAVFKDSFKEETKAPPGHPIHILMEEHKILQSNADELKKIAQVLRQAQDIESVSAQMEQVRRIEKHLKDSESHYLREENVLFPSLEKHGITEPPAVMWMEHDKIRAIKKDVYRIIDAAGAAAFGDFARQLDSAAQSLADMLSSHFFKENNILFPAALRVIGDNEWPDIRRQFDEIGYCCFTPEPAKAAFGKTVAVSAPVKESEISFETGAFSKRELESLLNALPVDITFVDKDDTVRYFSASKERIFIRTKAIIGRTVQQCHPQKSLHVVNQILADFKSGARDSAEFWINLHGRLIHIRYFAVRDNAGEYLGCVEVTQDITDIQKIKGEKRLL
jgi:hypothetical protein